VCKFDFEKRYGAIGKGFIHIHHLKPMASVRAMHDVSVDELVPVCANCHAMLHQRTPPLTPNELSDMI
jgi:5-methylcytosine-specific restriction protein A